MPFVQVARTSEHDVKRAAQEFAPMRVHVVFHDSILQYPAISAAFNDPTGPFQQALRVLSKGLMVRPVPGNITIPRTCSNITSGPNAGKCQNGTQEARCGVYTVPDELAGVQPEACNGSYGPCTEQTPGGVGVDADYILFAGSLTSKAHSQGSNHVLVFNLLIHIQPTAHSFLDPWLMPLPVQLMITFVHQLATLTSALRYSEALSYKQLHEAIIQ